MLYCKFLFLSIFTLISLHPTNSVGQETRKYVLSVDFGSNQNIQDYWMAWEGDTIEREISRSIPNVFNRTGVKLKITDSCSNLRTCGLRFVSNQAVSGNPLNQLIRDGLRVIGSKAKFVFEGLPKGYYDLRFFFHDSSVSSYDADLSLTITDSRSPSGTRLSNSINFSTGTLPEAISTFRFPIEISGDNKAVISLENSEANFIINGFELNKYKSVEKLPSGIELIGPHRTVEALISGYVDKSTPILACSINKQGQEYFGRLYSDENKCLSIIEGEVEEDQTFKLVKFDPYFAWYYVSSPQTPANSLVFTEVDGYTYYPCVAKVSNNVFHPGVYVPNFVDFCQVYDATKMNYYDKFYIYREK